MDTPERGKGLPIFDRNYTRREVLKGAATASAALAMSGIVAACGPGSSNQPAATTIKRGGTLRVGHVGGGKAETFNPAVGSGFIDASRYFNLFDPLTRVNPDMSFSPGLALEWNPNADSTVWEIKLRPGVVWHNGKSFTADDVIFTMKQMGDPAHVAHTSVTNIQLDSLKKLDPLTLRVPLKGPNARLFDSFVQQNTVMVQDGETDFSHPVGTGPFAFDSFIPGDHSLCKRNPSYWENGKPYVDAWEEVSIDDDTARLNALLAGQIDMMDQLPFAQAKAQLSRKQIQVINAPSPAIQVFLMATDIAPFNDPKVREAFRLIPDRKALIADALSGFGTIGNDLAGRGLPYFDNLPARTQDLEKAKSLLKQAGKDGLTVTLHTSEIVPGFVEAATLFAQQAQGAGVTVNVKKEPANSYFDTSLLYTHLDFAQSFWSFSALSSFYEQSLLSTAVWNETHWRDPSYDSLIMKAQGAGTKAEATDLWNQVQKVQYDQGGYIVWTNQNIVDGAANYVRGIVPSSFFDLGGFAYRNFWLDK